MAVNTNPNTTLHTIGSKWNYCTGDIAARGTCGGNEFSFHLMVLVRSMVHWIKSSQIELMLINAGECDLINEQVDGTHNPHTHDAYLLADSCFPAWWFEPKRALFRFNLDMRQTYWSSRLWSDWLNRLPTRASSSTSWFFKQKEENDTMFGNANPDHDCTQVQDDEMMRGWEEESMTLNWS